MKKLTVKTMTKMVIVCALYVALTFLLQPFSFGAIQLRISEVLMLLVLYNPYYSIPLTIGCAIANLFSPLGFIDLIFGTSATLLSCVIMILIKNGYISSIIPALFNGIIIGLELYYVFEIPFYLAAVEVFVGEFLAVSVIGVLIFRLLEENSRLMDLLEFRNVFKKKKNNI